MSRQGEPPGGRSSDASLHLLQRAHAMTDGVGVVTVSYKDTTCELKRGETLLDALLRAGVVVPFSCRAGICHTCLMQRVAGGPIPEAAQRGLTAEQRRSGYLLPCRCRPDHDMVVAPSSADRSRGNTPEFNEEPRRAAAPDPEMWAALGHGPLLLRILTEFYTRVYADQRLAPFFEQTSLQRSIEKQFNFLNQTFTGEDVYFGERPRNAHHWMVISDELFDYRSRLMESVLRQHQLPEHLIARWLAMEESYRKVIVKDRVWPRIIGGKPVPVEGYESLELQYSTLCDGCGAEMNVGDPAQLHVRLGTAYCGRCAVTAKTSQDRAESLAAVDRND